MLCEPSTVQEKMFSSHPTRAAFSVVTFVEGGEGETRHAKWLTRQMVGVKQKIVFYLGVQRFDML